jgi:hypothetical protein
MTYTRRNRVIQNKNTRKLKSGGGDLTVPNTTTILGYLDKGIHYAMVDDLQTNDMFSKYYKYNALKKESHLFNKSLLFDVLNNFEKKKDRVQHAFSNFVATDSKYNELKRDMKLEDTSSQYVIPEEKEDGNKEKKTNVFAKYLIRNTDVDVVNFIKVMHKFRLFLTTHKESLMSFPKFIELKSKNYNLETKEEFETKKEELKTYIQGCLSEVKSLIKDPAKRGEFNSKEPQDLKKPKPKIEYQEKDEKIDETKESQWSHLECEILDEYSDKSNTIYISLGEIVCDIKFCQDECIFFKDDEDKSTLEELTDTYNETKKREIQLSAQDSLNEIEEKKKKNFRKRFLLEVSPNDEKQILEDDIDFAVYNMSVEEFDRFIKSDKVNKVAKANINKFKETKSFNPFEKLKSVVTGALATGAIAAQNKSKIQEFAKSSSQ